MKNIFLRPRLKVVSKEKFLKEMEKIAPKRWNEIYGYMKMNYIVKYEFAHVPGRRIFRLTTYDGKVKKWDLIRK